MALQAQKTGRAGRSFAQLWQVPTFLLGVTAFICVAATAPLRQDPTGPAFTADIAFVRNILTKNACDSATQALAESLVARAGRFPDRLGEAHFLVGSVHHQLADAAADVQRIELRHKASVHLESALSLGVPAADSGTLCFSLGRLLFETGADMRRAAELITRSVDSKTVPAALGYGLLTKVHVQMKNVDGALAANQKHIDAIEKKHELEAALLLRGELWLQKDNRVEALKALDRIGQKAAAEVRMSARILQARCCEGEAIWSRAVVLWRDLLNVADKAGGRAHVLYHLGWCLANNVPADVADACKTWLECAELRGPEGQAALLRLGEISLRAVEPDPARAIDYFAKALVATQTAAEYQNVVLDLNAARSILDNACRVLEQTKEHRHLQELAEVYKRIALPGIAEEWLGRGLESHAHALRARETSASGAEADVARAEAQANYQKAGETFEQAARVRAAGQRSDVLWRSAACYLAAKDVVRAVVVLDHFVQEEKAEERLAEGWLKLAESYSALGKKEDARSAYYKCIEFPATPFAFRARYQLAVDEAAAKNVEQAYEILKQNLTSAGSGIDRETHERSLFKLGDVLFEHKDYDKACVYLKEAVERYPHNPANLAVRDRLGECYHELAKAAAKRWNDKQDRNHKLAHDGWLDKACAEYDKLADVLTVKASEETLSANDVHLLLRARLIAAEVQIKRGELADALRRAHDAFQKAPPRHLTRFRAFQLIDDCRKLLANMEERELLKRANELALTSTELLLIDLPRMQETDPPFYGSQGKEQWRNYLTALRNMLSATGSVVQ